MAFLEWGVAIIDGISVISNIISDVVHKTKLKGSVDSHMVGDSEIVEDALDNLRKHIYGEEPLPWPNLLEISDLDSWVTRAQTDLNEMKERITNDYRRPSVALRVTDRKMGLRMTKNTSNAEMNLDWNDIEAHAAIDPSLKRYLEQYEMVNEKMEGFDVPGTTKSNSVISKDNYADSFGILRKQLLLTKVMRIANLFNDLATNGDIAPYGKYLPTVLETVSFPLSNMDFRLVTPDNFSAVYQTYTAWIWDGMQILPSGDAYAWASDKNMKDEFMGITNKKQKSFQLVFVENGEDWIPSPWYNYQMKMSITFRDLPQNTLTGTADQLILWCFVWDGPNETPNIISEWKWQVSLAPFGSVGRTYLYTFNTQVTSTTKITLMLQREDGSTFDVGNSRSGITIEATDLIMIPNGIPVDYDKLFYYEAGVKKYLTDPHDTWCDVLGKCDMVPGTDKNFDLTVMWDNRVGPLDVDFNTLLAILIGYCYVQSYDIIDFWSSFLQYFGEGSDVADLMPLQAWIYSNSLWKNVSSEDRFMAIRALAGLFMTLAEWLEADEELATYALELLDSRYSMTSGCKNIPTKMSRRCKLANGLRQKNEFEKYKSEKYGKDKVKNEKLTRREQLMSLQLAINLSKNKDQATKEKVNLLNNYKKKYCK